MVAVLAVVVVVVVEDSLCSIRRRCQGKGKPSHVSSKRDCDDARTHMVDSLQIRCI